METTHSPRTLEETLGVIADALVSLADTQSKLLALTESRPAGTCSCKNGVKDFKDFATTERPAHTWTYEELKAELLKRGVEVAKGTKMTTLLKFWEMHKNDAEMQVAEESPAEESPAAVEETPVAEETEKLPPVPEEVKIDETIDAEELMKEPAKPMTMEEARKHIINSGYTATPEQTAAMKLALDKAGVTRFALIEEGGFEDFINTYFAELAKLEAAK